MAELSTPALVALVIGAAVFALGLVLPFLNAEYERRRDHRRIPGALPDSPSIEVILPAYLESGVVGDTVTELRRQLAQHSGATTITVVASDEDTALAAEAYGARVLRTQRRGKPAAINAGVHSSRADIIVLSDANCRLGPDDWPELLLAELSRTDLVSAVKGESETPEGAYWKYEAMVKNYGSHGTQTLAVVGEFMAFRRRDFARLPLHVLADDVQLAQDFALRGLTVRIVDGIVAVEPATRRSEQLERRIRISAGQWAQLIPHWRALLTVPAGRQFLAHKGYRMSLGALGFWAAFAGFALLLPPWTLLAALLMLGGSWLVYAYLPGAPALLTTAASVVVLQALTAAGLVRAVRRRLTSRPHLGWQKVAR